MQRLLFQGKEKDNNECLHMAGVKDMSKVILLEDPASKEKKMKELMKNPGTLAACEAVSMVRAEVDKLSNRVCQHCYIYIVVELCKLNNIGTRILN